MLSFNFLEASFWGGAQTSTRTRKKNSLGLPPPLLHNRVSISLHCVPSGAQTSRILFHVGRCVCRSEISSWKPKMPGPMRAALPAAFQTWKEALTWWADLALVAYCPLQKGSIILSRMRRLPWAGFTKVTFDSSLLFPNSGESMPFSYGTFWNLEDTGAVERQREEWIVFNALWISGNKSLFQSRMSVY